MLVLRRSAVRARTQLKNAKWFSAEASEATEEEEDKTRRKGKQQIIQEQGEKWLEGAGGRYKETMGRHWLHPDRPFPKNPWFVPPIPVDNKEKEEIYELYRADPMKWTPRKLGMKYDLSVLRIEAILRLKHLEKIQMTQGYVPQKSFRKQMELMLGCGTGERVKELIVREEYKKTLENAEDKPVAESEDMFKRRKDGAYVLKLSGVIGEEKEPEVLEVNLKEVNPRWKFVIEDISSSDRILVRDHDGTLRTATEQEKTAHKELYPRLDERKAELWPL